MKMTKQRWIGLVLGISVFLAAFGVAVGATIFFQVSRQVPATIDVFEVKVLGDETLGLYHDREAKEPLNSVRFTLPKLKEPLRANRTSTRSVFIRNHSDIALFLIEPCREVVVDGRRIGFMNPELFDMNGNHIRSLCDDEKVRLEPGAMVEARVNVRELVPDLEARPYPFTAVFGAVGETERLPTWPPAGLVGWWPGDGNANDIMGGNHGTLMDGATFASGMVGEAFSLDGEGDYVHLVPAPALGLTGDFTVDAWINISAFDGVDETVFGSDRTGDADNAIMHLVIRNRRPYMGFFGNDTTGNIELSQNTWYHIAFRYTESNGEQAIFVNGSLDVSSTGHVVFKGTGDVAIGQWGGGSYFNGLIDEVEVFDRALSDVEIRNIFDAGSEGKVKAPLPPRNVALQFDGAVDLVQIPDSASLDIQNAITVEAWVWSVREGDSPAWASKYGSSWDLHHNAFFISRSPGENESLNYSSPAGRWVHIAAVYDGSDQYVYIDGVLNATRSWPGSINTGDSPVLIGSGHFHPDQTLICS